MFYQVKLPEEDRDMLRFLWWPGGDVSKPLVECRATVHLFGAKSSGSIAAYALQRTAEEATGSSAETRSIITRNMYVDDVLKASDDEDQLIKEVLAVRALCASRGFRLCKFVSNSADLINSLPMEDVAPQSESMEIRGEKDARTRTLGLSWYTSSDMLQVDVNIEPRPNTRRGALSQIASVFDVIGIAFNYSVEVHSTE